MSTVFWASERCVQGSREGHPGPCRREVEHVWKELQIWYLKNLSGKCKIWCFIMVYHGLSWFIMVYHSLSMFIITFRWRTLPFRSIFMVDNKSFFLWEWLWIRCIQHSHQFFRQTQVKDWWIGHWMNMQRSTLINRKSESQSTLYFLSPYLPTFAPNLKESLAIKLNTTIAKQTTFRFSKSTNYPLIMTNIANWKDPPFLMSKRVDPLVRPGDFPQLVMYSYVSLWWFYIISMVIFEGQPWPFQPWHKPC